MSYTQDDYIELGSAPAFEDCAQYGEPDFFQRSFLESQTYLRQLKRLFPQQVFRVKYFPHGYEVVVVVDPSNPDAAVYVESHLPSHWDAIAKQKLAKLKQN